MAKIQIIFQKNQKITPDIHRFICQLINSDKILRQQQRNRCVANCCSVSIPFK